MDGDAYGYAHLRLYVHIFMLWLAAAFLWLLAALWARPDRFAVGGLVAALGFLVTVNLVNPDEAIARQNLARYRATGRLDAAYLTSAVSEDGVPVLVAALPGASGAVRAALLANLRRRLTDLERDPARRDWPSFVLARQQAYDALARWRKGAHLRAASVASATTVDACRIVMSSVCAASAHSAGSPSPFLFAFA